ncbi:MAG: hypothetical protein QM790_09950 [Nibricoccus sp.]
MSNEHRSLMMRANRLLGANLVEMNLIKIEDLETANERLLEVAATGNARQSTVLGILSYEMKVVKEEDVLHHLVEDHSVGLVDLRGYEGSEELKKKLDLGACWATWTVPFDQDEGFYFLATAYYMSPAVRTFWEKQLDGPIVWYGATLEMLGDYLEKLEVAAGGKAEAEA